MRSITSSDVEVYLEAARNGDHRNATALVMGLLDDGLPVDTVIEDVLAAAQREAGLRWLTARWTVADEHVTTTTTTAVVEAIAAAAAEQSERGDLVAVCAEGDWHSMASRLGAQLLRARGWRVRCLGASTPADHVDEYLTRARQDGLVITCSLPLHYAGAARLVEVAHRNGVPALIGGAAIADDPRRAIKLGADAAVRDIAEADAVLGALGGIVPPGEPVVLDEAALLLAAEADAFATTALARLSQTVSTGGGYGAQQLSCTHEDLACIVQFAAAAVLVQDPTVWTSFANWQRTLLDARGVAEGAFTAGVEAVSEQIRAKYPNVADLLDAVVREP